MSKQKLAPNTIGASQAASACGQHPYSPRITLWQTLRGELPPFEGNEATEWGGRLEGAIRRRYEEIHERRAYLVDESLVHGDGWARATPDGIVLDKNEDWDYGLEVKTTNARNAHRWGESGSDIYPIEYRYQLAWSCWVCDLPRWDLAVLIGGQDYREYTYMRDPDFEMVMVTYAERFWKEHVLTGTPPPPDASKEYKDFLAGAHPEPSGDLLDADETASKFATLVHHHKDIIKANQELLGLAENHLLAIIGRNPGIKVPGGVVRFTKRKGGKKWKDIAAWYRRQLESMDGIVPSEWKLPDGYFDNAETAFTGKDSRTPYYPRNWTIPGGDTDNE